MMSRRRALFSPCTHYRYTLWREWIGGSGTCAFIGLNPSTATDTIDDPTIRRCSRYAQAWGYQTYLMLNLFAWRDTDPRRMKSASDPVGPLNDDVLVDQAQQASIVIAAWGAHGTFNGRSDAVRQMMNDADVTLHYLALTKDGHPGHPLYLKSTLTPTPWI